MESRLGLKFENSWAFLDGSLNGYNDDNLEGLFLQVNWYVQMVKCLSLMKASK